ncbi:uncharacterized protein LOC112054234 [Bicyclus anynana]|uniref:Regulatory protein zeste n=1 Tax=Bicyclus anynana TaxID=110368 RepID=A0A6J1NWU6_BICAN|nr:uncharacterized protein LOC112054234 [Bicyclus anynana]
MEHFYQKVTFTHEEKELLVNLLKFEKIIEDKRTNKSTNKLKAEAWDRVTNKFNNNTFVTKRATIQLRRCWEKIKKHAKDDRTKEIKTRMATGGGSPCLPSQDYVPGVEEVVPHLMIEIPGTIDSNTIFESERQTETSITTTCTISTRCKTPIMSQSILQDCDQSVLRRYLDSTQTACETMNNQINEHLTSRMNIIISPEAETIEPTDTCNISSPLMPRTELPYTERRRRLASTAASEVITLRKNNILKERNEQQDLYKIRRSILEIEFQKESEMLRHLQKLNSIKEMNELEILEHQRALRKIELQRALEHAN